MVGFRHISEVLADMKLTTGELAARATQVAQSFEVGAPLQGGESEAPMPVEVAPANRVKGRGAKPRQVQNRGVARAREEDDTRSVVPPALVLVVDNGMRGVHRRPYGASPASAPRSPLLMLVGGRDHATLP
jgi:hypothetical protein